MTPEKPTVLRRNILVVGFIVVTLAYSVLYNYPLLAQVQQQQTGTLLGAQQQDGVASLQALSLTSTTTATSSASGTAVGIEPSSSGVTDAQSIYTAASHSVVTVQGDETVSVTTNFGRQTSTGTVLGSGFVISYQDSYYVITNYHVVDGVTNQTVTFWNGDSYPARVVGTDPYSDLAVVTLMAPSSEFVSIQVVSSSSVAVGNPVFAIGNPYGLSGSFTSGIVSQLGRTIQEAATGNYSIAGVIQFSAPINPGNSGGPLLDANGRVIGITTATVSGSVGVEFAIPSSTILRELPSLISTGTYTEHSYLGIAGTDMNYQLAQAEKTNVTYGVLLENVVAGGPASNAGLHVGTTTATIDGQQYLIGGDIIVSVNGTRIVNQDAPSTYLEQNTVAGQTIQLGIFRSGNLETVNLLLGARPSLSTG